MDILKSTGVATTGVKRGSYKWKIENLLDFELGSEFESAPFYAGGFKWSFVLQYIMGNFGQEAIRVLLVSNNARGVSAIVDLSVVNLKHPSDREAQAVGKTARPYSVIHRQCVPVSGLSLSNAQQELTIEVVLKNIEEASSDEQRDNQCDMRTVKLEVINRKSIAACLREGNITGLVPLVRVQHSELPTCGMVCCWTRSFPDHRYWLCKRGEHGSISVEKRLNQTGILKRFEEICDKDNSGQSWITVFKEEVEKHSHFTSTDDDTTIVFCKLFDAAVEDTTYLGHLLVRKSEECQNLLSHVAHDTAQFPDGIEYSAFIEDGHRVTEITNRLGQLKKCGMDHGCTIILTMRESKDDLMALLASRAISDVHVGVTEADKDRPQENAEATGLLTKHESGPVSSKGEAPLPSEPPTVDVKVNSGIIKSASNRFSFLKKTK